MMILIRPRSAVDVEFGIDYEEFYGVRWRARANHLRAQSVDFRKRSRNCRVRAYDRGLSGPVFAPRLHDSIWGFCHLVINIISEMNQTKTKDGKRSRPDSQLVEIAGRNWLCSQLVLAGLEVARPERDRGIDLIAYIDLDESKRFIACPIQMKAATNESFSVHRKYERFPGMLHVHVWHLGDPGTTVAYALSFKEAATIARRKRWTRTASWRLGSKGRNPGYGVNTIDHELRKLLDPFKIMGSRSWRTAIDRCMSEKPNRS